LRLEKDHVLISNDARYTKKEERITEILKYVLWILAGVEDLVYVSHY